MRSSRFRKTTLSPELFGGIISIIYEIKSDNVVYLSKWVSLQWAQIGAIVNAQLQ